MKTQTIAQLRKQADRLVQQVYLSENFTCLACGSPAQVLHHFIQKKQSNNLRFDPRNLVPLCVVCHCRHHIAGDPSIVISILREKGQVWADDLQRRRKKLVRFNKTYLNEVIARLKLKGEL